jgi:hypothetical protein
MGFNGIRHNFFLFKKLCLRSPCSNELFGDPYIIPQERSVSN